VNDTSATDGVPSDEDTRSDRQPSCSSTNQQQAPSFQLHTMAKATIYKYTRCDPDRATPAPLSLLEFVRHTNFV